MLGGDYGSCTPKPWGGHLMGGGAFQDHPCLGNILNMPVKLVRLNKGFE